MAVETDIEISEVGPRDGLQSIKAIMPTAAKKAWIAALAAAGLPEIEVGSFVPAAVLPQLADTAELVAFARTIPGLRVAVLVPNLKGAAAAIDAGAHKISIPVSASETHSLKNVKRSHDQMIEEIRAIRDLIDAQPADRRPKFDGGLSTAFGCTIEGPVSETLLASLSARMVEAGVDEIGLSDTTGYANPLSVRRRIAIVRDAVGADRLTGVHLHNTRGNGLANALAALDSGITTFDSSLGGIGGCPFAPGASGNIVTEDLVYMFDSMGLRTGIDLEKLFAARDVFKQALPDEPVYGFVPEAGLPLGYQAG